MSKSPHDWVYRGRRGENSWVFGDGFELDDICWESNDGGWRNNALWLNSWARLDTLLRYCWEPARLRVLLNNCGWCCSILVLCVCLDGTEKRKYEIRASS